jgi:fructokinase
MNSKLSALNTSNTANTSSQDHPYKIGIDLGGTKIEAVVLDQANRELFRRRIPTQAQLGADHILNQIQDLYLQASRLYPHHCVGVGTPGSLSAQSGLLRNSNTQCLNGLDLKKCIEEKIQQAITIENDANCFALAEALMGAGKGFDCVFGVIMGTGCGGGIVVDQKLRKGPQRIAGEWGHMVIDPSGLPCFCGHSGCVETYISGSGVERHYEQHAGGKTLSAEEIFTRSHLNPNGVEAKVVHLFYEKLSIALSNLMCVLDPDVIVLGGGLSNIEGLVEQLKRQLSQHVLTDHFTTPILINTLGDSAGVIGAALIGATSL